MNEQEFIDSIELCVKCGACKPHCPTFSALGLETQSPRGRVQILKYFERGVLNASLNMSDKVFGCLMCGKCSKICPLGIKLDEVFYYSRNLLRTQDKKRSFLRLLTRLAFENTDMSITLSKPFHRLINRSLVHKGFLPKDIEYCETPFQKTGIFRSKGERIGRIAIFSGCTIKHIYPELAFSVGHVLSACNYEVVFPNTEVCCGAPHRGLGMDDTAKRYAKKNFDSFKHLNVDAIVCLCPTCIVALKKHYPILLETTFENKIYGISDFLVDKIIEPKNPFKQKVAYHDPCHSANFLDSTKEPRELLKAMGAEIAEPQTQICCGFGGTFSFMFKQVSDTILNMSASSLLNTNASAIVTGCPNCILQLSKQITDRPIYHIIEIIEEAIL